MLRDLRVRFVVVPALSVGDLLPRSEVRVNPAAYAAILMTVGDETAYAAVPAPKFPGQEAVFAPLGAKALPGSIETGRLGDDVAALAGRITERVREG